MKKPDIDQLKSLSKATVADPVIAGHANVAGNAGNTPVAGNAGEIRKFTIRLHAELLGRIRAAYLADMAHGNGAGSLSAWAAEQLSRAVDEAEKRNGVRLSPVETGVLPTGPLS